MERAKHGSLSWSFWLNWFSGWGSKTLHIKGFPASFPVYLPAWHILAVHRYLTYNWMVLCLCEACSRDMGWLSSGGQPFDYIPFTGKWFQCWFPVPPYYLGVIFLSLYHPHFQRTWPSHSLLLHIHLQLLGEAFSGRTGGFTWGRPL